MVASRPRRSSRAPIRWGRETNRLVIHFAQFWGNKFDLPYDDREDLVSECLIKSHKKVTEGAIRYNSALYTLCKRKALDYLRKRGRVTENETTIDEYYQSEEKFAVSMDDPVSSDVSDYFPELYQAARILAEGGDPDEAARAVGVDPLRFESWLDDQQKTAREFFNVKLNEDGTITLCRR